jgi:hypothetical protein
VKRLFPKALIVVAICLHLTQRAGIPADLPASSRPAPPAPKRTVTQSLLADVDIRSGKLGAISPDSRRLAVVVTSKSFLGLVSCPRITCTFSPA